MVAILYNIRSLYNVGSIFRTADAAGFKKLYLCGITPGPKDEFDKPRKELAKVSLGAEKYLEWDTLARTLPKTLNLIKELKNQDYKILAIEQSKKSIPYYKFFKSYISKPSVKGGKFCLIIGNEINGLPPSILNLADKTLEIPMYGQKESLNVSVAFGIVAFHIKNIEV